MQRTERDKIKIYKNITQSCSGSCQQIYLRNVPYLCVITELKVELSDKKERKKNTCGSNKNGKPNIFICSSITQKMEDKCSHLNVVHFQKVE